MIERSRLQVSDPAYAGELVHRVALYKNHKKIIQKGSKLAIPTQTQFGFWAKRVGSKQHWIMLAQLGLDCLMGHNLYLHLY